MTVITTLLNKQVSERKTTNPRMVKLWLAVLVFRFEPRLRADPFECSYLTQCKFRCTNGRCLKLLSLICNHLNECGDNSDEEHCPPAAVPPPPDTIQSRVCLSGAAPLSEEGSRDARRWGVSLRRSRKAILLNERETKRASGCGERIYPRRTAARASDDGMKRERTERQTPTAAVNVSVSSCEGRGRRLSRPRPVTFPEPPCETSRSRTAAPETTTPTPMTHAPATAPYPSHREWIYCVNAWLRWWVSVSVVFGTGRADSGMPWRFHSTAELAAFGTRDPARLGN
ncbi:hypothetical protein E1301_Tti019274 [Triplophysa tibetana]|uniref:Uncharacterized protein n=1 Tax=Triplophysa tibetana TaxID=1572043 RepID=A0A5A9NN28_9TELE|nr:hypothetical protein E1301_Tti019274 [Triplophysa tibetana]